MPIEFTVVHTSTAPPEAVFDVLTNHGDVADWFWMCRRSTVARVGAPSANGVGAIRRLTSYGTTFVEGTTQYERPVRWSYTMLAGAPTRDHFGTVDVHPANGGSEIRWHVRATPTVPGCDWLVLWGGRWVIDQMVKKAAATAEHAQVSERKLDKLIQTDLA